MRHLLRDERISWWFIAVVVPEPIRTALARVVLMNDGMIYASTEALPNRYRIALPSVCRDHRNRGDTRTQVRNERLRCDFITFPNGVADDELLGTSHGQVGVCIAKLRRIHDRD